MGVGDVSTSLWAECQAQCGMHFSATDYVHVELIDPETEQPVKWQDGATGELVYTHLRREAAPLVRFRSRDHVIVWTSRCACGRTTPRIRCIGRTDDMLIVRGVNVFPSAVREVVSWLRPRGQRRRRHPPAPPRRQAARRRCRSRSSSARAPSPDGLALRIAEALRARLLVACEVELVAWGSLRAQRLQVEAARLVRAEGSATCASCQSQGVHHITLVGSDRQTSIDFSEGVLGMPFVFERPNLRPGRPKATSTSTPATAASSPSSPTRAEPNRGARRPSPAACITLAFAVSAATFRQAVERLDERSIEHSGVKDRGFIEFDLLRGPDEACWSSSPPIASSRPGAEPTASC